MNNRQTFETSAAAAETSFERQKWEDEKIFRQADQRRLDQELALKLHEAQRSRWRSPLVIAIIGAALAGSGNALVALLNANNQQCIEEHKA
jgi:hypothetical protein